MIQSPTQICSPYEAWPRSQPDHARGKMSNPQDVSFEFDWKKNLSERLAKYLAGNDFYK
jgi:hypothetical protein